MTSPTTSDEAPRTGRYSLDRARAEIIRVVQGRGHGAHVRLARALSMSSQTLTKQLNGTYYLEVETIGLIADIFSAPTGWPWVPWPEAEDRDTAFRNRNRRKSQG